MGVYRQFINDILTVKKPYRQPVLSSFADRGVNLNWLLTGKVRMMEAEAPGDATLLIPHYGVALGAGDEKVPPEKPPTDWSPYSRDEVIRMASSTEHLVELEVDGESMMPTFYPGERVLVDMNKHRALKDGIWAIRIGDGLLIKRLAVAPDGTIQVLSDNPAYPPKIIQSAEAQGFAIVGKVLMVAKRL